MPGGECGRRRLLLCRCEEVTVDQVVRQFEAGAWTPEELKRYTRVTMGPCQGRVCRPLFLRLWRDLVAAAGKSLDDVAPGPGAGLGAADLPLPSGARLPGFRPPVRPVTVNDVAGLSVAAPEKPSHASTHL